MPESALGLSMPRFMLQPIIENAIKHSELPASCPVHISLSLREDSGRLRFTVTDNGRGVPPELALEIQQKLLANSADSEASIGLYNTNARIKLLYGEEYGILFSSVRDMGTSVTLTIPSATA